MIMHVQIMSLSLEPTVKALGPSNLALQRASKTVLSERLVLGRREAGHRLGSTQEEKLVISGTCVLARKQ